MPSSPDSNIDQVTKTEVDSPVFNTKESYYPLQFILTKIIMTFPKLLTN